MATLEYIAIERPIGQLATRKIADKYQRFAQININGQTRAYLYPQTDGLARIIFLTTVPSEENGYECESITMYAWPEELDHTLTRLASLLPPF